MSKSKKSVPEEDRAKLFLWCDRHCCFCGKKCTTNIEIHHIDEDTSNNDIDNLIPLCFDCHGELPRYNAKHPKGSKYYSREVKTRRDQIYEEHTRKYLRQVNIHVSRFIQHTRDRNGKPIARKNGDTSCTVKTTSNNIPVKLKVRIEAYQDNQKINTKFGDLYKGEALWNLNPTQIVFAHFELPISKKADPFLYRVEIIWSIIDILDRKHHMLPFSYVWDDTESDWWYDPRILYSKEV